MKTYRCLNIDWDICEEDLGLDELPDIIIQQKIRELKNTLPIQCYLEVDSNTDMDESSDMLTGVYGYLINQFDYEEVLPNTN